MQAPAVHCRLSRSTVWYVVLSRIVRKHVFLKLGTPTKYFPQIPLHCNKLKQLARPREKVGLRLGLALGGHRS